MTAAACGDIPARRTELPLIPRKRLPVPAGRNKTWVALSLERRPYRKFDRRLWLTFACATAVLTSLATPPAMAEATSASFELRASTLTSLAEWMTSPSFNTTVTAVTVSGTAGVCPSGSVATLGFWSVMGSRNVPVQLTLSKSVGNPNQVDLSWTGQSSAFAVYRSTSPNNVVSVENLYRTTTSCEETDESAEAFEILFYVVETIEQ